MHTKSQKFAIFKKLELQNGFNDVAWIIRGIANGEDRQIPVDSIDQVATNYWIANAHEGDVQLLIRPTVETDVLNSITVQASYPLPVDVIQGLLEPVHMPPKLYAVSEDDGFVATMMLSSDTGMYMRYSSEWHTLVPDVVDELNVTEVEGSALDRDWETA